MTQYIAVDALTNRVRYGCGAPDPEDFTGPPSPAPDAPEGVIFQAWQGALNFSGAPFPGATLMFASGQPFWHDDRTLEATRAEAIAQIDAFADGCRIAVVGDAARIKEYERAQLGAEQYRDAGYTGAVPPPVASWAYAKRRLNWTARQAAEDILAASARWYAALDGIRALRLDAKETIRAASTGEEVAATAATFRATLTAAMQGVQ